MLKKTTLIKLLFSLELILLINITTKQINAQISTNDYFIYPLSTDVISNYNQGLEDMVVEQGYEATCAGADLTMQTDILGQLSQYTTTIGEVRLDGSLNYTPELSKARVPLFTNMFETGTEVKVNSSFEGFFGAQPTLDNLENALSYQEYSGVAYSRTSFEHQCKHKINLLRTAKKMCNMLSDPSTCVLNKEIGDTGYYYFSTDPNNPSLLDEFEYYLNSEDNIDCYDYAVIYDDGYNTITETKYNEIELAINTTPLNLPYIYRVAFLVIATDQSYPLAEPNDPSITKNFWFRKIQNNGTIDNANSDSIIVLPFKIPDIITNKPLSLIADNYQDAAQIAISSLSDYNLDRDIQEEREEKLSQINNVKNSGEKLNVDAYNTSDYTDNILNRILVDIINGTADSRCTSKDINDPIIKYEEAGHIYTPANLISHQNRIFNNNYLQESELINSYNNQSKTFNWTLKTNSPTYSQDTVPVRIYLVSPIGEELKHLENTIQFFVPFELKEKIEEINMTDNTPPVQGIPEYYPLAGSALNYNSSGDSVTGNSNGQNITLSSSQQLLNPTSNYYFHIPGAKLGFYIKLIQQTGHSIESNTIEALKDCRTEEMFLGKCGGITGDIEDEIDWDEEFPIGDYDPNEFNCPTSALINLFEKSGKAYNMPPGVIAGIAKIEGTHMWGLSDEQVIQYSQEGAQYPTHCSPNACGARGPMQFLNDRCSSYGWNTCPAGCALDVWANHKNSSQIDYPSRTTHICNIIDSIYAAAHKLNSQCRCNGVWNQQAVYNSSKAYYGSCESCATAKPGTGAYFACQRFNGRTYCEYVWQYHSYYENNCRK